MKADWFQLEKNPKKGLLWVEWASIAYLVLTTIYILFAYVKIENPMMMLTGRLRALAVMAALWLVYRMVPCKATILLRILGQMLLLAWWYPDTYDLNRILPNRDYIVAGWDQALFGCQPALLFAKQWSSRVVSELLCMGYFSYYPMICLTILWYFFGKNREVERCAFIIIGAFFIYYVIFGLFPVVGPIFYYKAAGVDNIAKGVFPHLGDYFLTHTDALTLPGWPDGLFHRLVLDAQEAGERPTAAFPSSHVGISTICMLLAWHYGRKTLLTIMAPFYVLLCAATVYIQAHYLVDVLGGWATALVIYALLFAISGKMSNFAIDNHKRTRRK